MATAKKRGAPASASKTERVKQVAPRLGGAALAEQRRADKAARRKVNSEEYRAGRQALKDMGVHKIALPDNTQDVGRTKHYDDMTEEQLQWFEDQVIICTPVDDMPGLRPDFPNQFQLWRGIASEHSAIAKAYARGKQISVSRKEELIEQVANTPQTGIITVRGQRVTTEGDIVDVVEEKEYDMLGHRALVIDTLKWSLAHIRPKKHGKTPEVGSGGVTPQLQALFDSLKQGPAE